MCESAGGPVLRLRPGGRGRDTPFDVSGRRQMLPIQAQDDPPLLGHSVLAGTLSQQHLRVMTSKSSSAKRWVFTSGPVLVPEFE